jgi:hypothetical protein
MLHIYTGTYIPTSKHTNALELLVVIERRIEARSICVPRPDTKHITLKKKPVLGQFNCRLDVDLRMQMSV